MTIHFIGAGPGDPELITVRGLRLIKSCNLCLFAGSLVPEAVVAEAPGQIIDTASMTLDQIMDEIQKAHKNGDDIARVHSGDPSLYGAIAEQVRRLQAIEIPYEITPGVPAYAAAAAKMGRELTIPEINQTVILTRTAMKSSSMPKGEELETLGKSNATLVIHLSVRNLRDIERSLIPLYGEDCPAIIAYRVGWPDEKFLHGTLSTIRQMARAEKITRTALIFVGKALKEYDDFRDSALYDGAHPHILRPKRTKPKVPKSGEQKTP